MASVGRSYAILRGRMGGDSEKAREFLSNLSPGERRARNNTESRSRGNIRKRKRALGQPSVAQQRMKGSYGHTR